MTLFVSVFAALAKTPDLLFVAAPERLPSF
jgi:hypothetical protein